MKKEKALVVAALCLLTFLCLAESKTNQVPVRVAEQKEEPSIGGGAVDAGKVDAGRESVEDEEVAENQDACGETDISLGEASDDAGRLFYLALAYEFGDHGLNQDCARAMLLYREAAKAGSTSAMVNLGHMYKEGIGVATNNARAFYWFKKAADAGDPVGIHQVALAKAFGLGVERDFPEAKILLLRNSAYEPSASWLRSFIKDQDVTRSLVLAVEERDDRLAALSCAERYGNEDAAEFDMLYSARYYGAYFYGKDFLVSSHAFVQRDESRESESRIRDLLEAGLETNVNAVVELARACANPSNRAQNLAFSEKLYHYLVYEIELHDKKLRKELESEYKSLKNEMIAFTYTRDRALNGEIDAMAELGRRYLEGRGVSYNYPFSIIWFKSAVKAQLQSESEKLQTARAAQKQGDGEQGKEERGLWNRIVRFAKNNWRTAITAIVVAALLWTIYWFICFVVRKIRDWRANRRFNAIISDEIVIDGIEDADSDVEKDVDIEEEDPPFPPPPDVKTREDV